MNSSKILELYLDGAYLVSSKDGDRLYHPSFRKGYRKVSGDSAWAARTKLSKLGKLWDGLIDGKWVVKAI